MDSSYGWWYCARPRCAVSSQAHLDLSACVMDSASSASVSCTIVLTVNKLLHDRDLRTHNQQAIYHHQENAGAYSNALINLPMSSMSFHNPSEKVLLCLRIPIL
jgi:hypothetical protein